MGERQKLKSELILQKSTLDKFDMKRFYSFFKDLYKEKKLEIHEAEKQEMQHMLHASSIILSLMMNSLRISRISDEYFATLDGSVL